MSSKVTFKMSNREMQGEMSTKNIKKRPSIEDPIGEIDQITDALKNTNQELSQSLRPIKRRKKNGKSLDEYFEFLFIDKLKMAKCKICSVKKQEEIFIKMTSGNTTGVKRHLEKHHVQEFEEVYPIFSSQAETFAQGQFNKKTVDWVVRKYLPYNFFDDDETQEYFNYINPLAKLPMRNELRSLVCKRFSDMQESVMRIVQKNKSKFSYTMDSWTSVSSRSYHSMTIHFIDDNWVLHSLLIDFCPSNGEHSGRNIASAFYKIVTNYGLEEKVQGITVDNASANTTFMRELSYLMIFDFENQHFRCYAHILNLSAQDMLKELKLEDSSIDQEDENYQDIEMDKNDQEDIGHKNIEVMEEADDIEEEFNSCSTPLAKLRKLFSKLKNSEQCCNKLKSCCESCNIKFRSPNIDVCTRWYSSEEMIKLALGMEKPLVLLCQNNAALRHLLLTEKEWLILREVCKYLRHFKVLSKLLSGDKYVTLPYVVIGFNMLVDKLDEEIEVLKEKTSKNKNPVFEQIMVALQAARDKLFKHYDKSNWIYCAVLILDPRHKVDMFNKTSWGKEMAAHSVDVFETMYRTNYYVPQAEQVFIFIETSNS